VLSGNGRFVLFASVATNLHADDGDANHDVFRRDLLGSAPAAAMEITVHAAPPPAAPAPAPAAPAVKRLCQGRAATIIGTAGRDVLRGTPRADVIVALGGNDVVRGLGGNDRICAGAGNDRVVGGAGTDRLLGGAGKDLLVGGAGKDLLLGGRRRGGVGEQC
jgi:Ca2+-binding RTX toxin-like protein